MAGRLHFTIDGVAFYAVLRNHTLAESLLSMCPFSVNYTRSGGHEYYASLPKKAVTERCPNWWDTLPMPVVGFMEHYDWTGKRIIPFVTSGGSGFGKSLEDLKKICTGAIVEENGGEFLGHLVETSGEEINAWAKNIL